MKLLIVTVLLTTFSCCQTSADIVILSVERGVFVDGTTTSNSTTGVFNTSDSNTNEFGTASAELMSDVQSNRFLVRGSASEDATELDESFETRARLFFDVSFLLNRVYRYDLNGWLGGDSEDEHWLSKLTLIGPGTHLSFTSEAPLINNIEENGILGPGNYLLEVEAYPIVFGGLDFGDATAFIEGPLFNGPLSFELTSVPEPGLAGLLGFSLAGFYLVRRRK